MTRRSGTGGALDVVRFKGLPAHALAVVVHKETEAERAAASLAFRLEHGDTPVQLNALAPLLPPFDRNESRSWSEYLSLPVVVRCAEALKISGSALLGRIIDELYPSNWEALWWQGEYHRAVEESSREIVETQMRLEEQANKFAAKTLAIATAGGKARSKKRYGEVKAYVLLEWTLKRDEYNKNKTKFAKDYARMVKNQVGLDIADSTITDSWLKGK